MAIEQTAPADRGAPHNLPLPLPPLLGRERELAQGAARLRAPATRLLTLTGVGGVGKTRLALALAAAALAQFPDGVWLVHLAPLQDPALLAGAIAHVLGVREAGGSLEQQLVEHLRDRQVLLVLDNCEHLRDACAVLVGTLLAACPGLRVLATSRAPLRLPDERRLPVPPLALPAEDAGPEAVVTAPAVALFVARARAIEPSFTLDAANAAAVAHICRRLDGLPLALELAAARLKGRTPAALLEELGERLRALGAGGHQREVRQRTLRALLDWSYTLLGPGEQALFARLAAFAGGWTLAAAATVCPIEDDLPFAVGEGLASLAEQSLVQGPDPAGRHGMLETVREYAGYALARLAAPEDAERVRRRHADYFLALAEEAAPHLTGLEQSAWLARLEAEHDNLRAALQWSLDGGESALGLRLAGALWRFWATRGYLAEGRGWLEAALAGGEPGSSAARATALHGAGVLASQQSDYARAAALYEEALALRRALGDRFGIAASLNNLGIVAQELGDHGRAAALHEESLALKRVLGDSQGIAYSLNNLGLIAQARGDYARARTLYEEGLDLVREQGDKQGTAISLDNLGAVARMQGDYGRALALLEEALALRRALGNQEGIADTLTNLGIVADRQDDHTRAAALHEEALALRRELGNRSGIATSLSRLGELADRQGDHERAAALLREALLLSDEVGTRGLIAGSLEILAWLAAARGGSCRAAQIGGAAEALREALGTPLPPARQAGHDRAVQTMRAALGEHGWAAAWAEGRALPPEQAIALALADDAIA